MFYLNAIVFVLGFVGFTCLFCGLLLTALKWFFEVEPKVQPKKIKLEFLGNAKDFKLNKIK